jgi:superfamily II DNA or RNA helicase
MAFRIIQQSEKEYPDPEALFADIKQKKSRGLLSHQADIIRNFVSQGIDKSDVSIQLSTGAGKTLIGLLIGEWLLQKDRERVLYLCPTNQLVFQVHNQAKEQYDTPSGSDLRGSGL